MKWTAPEALHYKKYSTASDVWSFGMVMYEIWALGLVPFDQLTNIQVYYYGPYELLGYYVQALHEIEAGHSPLPPPGCPRNIYTLMMQCW